MSVVIDHTVVCYTSLVSFGSHEPLCSCVVLGVLECICVHIVHAFVN